MDDKFLRQIKDYKYLVDSLPLADNEQYSEQINPKHISLTSQIAATDFARSLLYRCHNRRPIRHCWPVHMSLLHHQHPLLFPLTSTSTTTYSKFTKYKPFLRKLSKIVASYGLYQADLQHVMAARVADMVDRVFESSLRIRYLAECKETDASPWDVVLAALKCNADDVLVKRVLRRVSRLVVESKVDLSNGAVREQLYIDDTGTTPSVITDPPVTVNSSDTQASSED